MSFNCYTGLWYRIYMKEMKILQWHILHFLSQSVKGPRCLDIFLIITYSYSTTILNYVQGINLWLKVSVCCIKIVFSFRKLWKPFIIHTKMKGCNITFRQCLGYVHVVSKPRLSYSFSFWTLCFTLIWQTMKNCPFSFCTCTMCRTSFYVYSYINWTSLLLSVDQWEFANTHNTIVVTSCGKCYAFTQLRMFGNCWTNLISRPSILNTTFQHITYYREWCDITRTYWYYFISWAYVSRNDGCHSLFS